MTNFFCFLQKAFLKFKIGNLEHRNMNNGLLQFRRHAWCSRCQTKMKRAGFVKPCFYTLHICGYVPPFKSHILVAAPTGSGTLEAKITTSYPVSRACLGTFPESSYEANSKSFPIQQHLSLLSEISHCRQQD